jgi:hypothetical protein
MQSNARFATDASYPSVPNRPQAGPSYSVLTPLPFRPDSGNLPGPLTIDEPQYCGAYPHTFPQERHNDRASAWASRSSPPLASVSDSEFERSELEDRLPPRHIASPTQMTPSTPTVQRRADKKSRLSKEQRINFLQNDEYVLSFTEARVCCAGCLKQIKLDGRNGAEYYLRFWGIHRDRCSGVTEGIVSTSKTFWKNCYVDLCVRLPQSAERWRLRKDPEERWDYLLFYNLTPL